ncbi:MAG: isoleucine--tRNA ligase, partial [Spirochaetota bacterium]|nr:isoleucine--tRNA ligase [Spirochaetota bacterium]
MYNEVPSKISFPKMEEEILEFWEKKHIFNKSIEQRMDKEDFVFYDGPPGTNGYPHIGHMLQSTLKDLWPRYKTMKGFRVIRKAGWDTHGLPVELTAEKELGLTSKKDIIKYGIDKFIDYCRKTVFRYKEEWVTAIKRIGRFLDFDDEYATLTNEFIQSDWWVLKQAWNKGLVYKDYKIIAYCPRLGTSLSNHEVAQGYRDVVDISIFAKFPLKNESNTSFIAWTTTPWTLLGNVALALGEDIDYVKIQVNDEYYIFAEERIQALKDKGFLKDYKLIQRYKGKDLVDIDYIPLWDFHSHLPERKHFTLNDDYVTTEDGTGIVHLALYGEDDYRLIKKNNLPYVQHVDLNGLFTEECGEYANHYFDEDAMDIKILKDLSSKNLVFAKEKYEHTYPFNYRTGTKLIYFAKSSWFLKTTAFKDQMIKANQDINWYPSHIRDGRFGNWLENNVDWDISRERYWGSPLPIWTCINESCGHQICVSSIDELNEFAITRIDDNFDLHVPKIDTVMCKCNKCGSEMKREPDVLDCWYNSGVMPWGQLSYPSKKGSDKLLKKLYPADFICEGLDQTRGWFYALIALSTMLTNQSSYKNVI